MSQSRGIKGATTDEAFQAQWERGAFTGMEFRFFNFENLLSTWKGEKSMIEK